MKHIFIIALLISPISQAQEDFADISNLVGWEMSNQSSPIGDFDWFQGNQGEFNFNSHAGEPSAYIAANYQNTGNNGTICNFLTLPDLNLTEMTFWTRSSYADDNNSIFPDRLLVLYSPNGQNTPGDCTTNFGDFTEELLSINPNLTTEGYPLVSWEEFTVNVPGPGRIAFVYYVSDAGSFGINSNYIGIDTVSWVEWEDDVIFANNFED